jgi:hypothetical protein
MNQEITLARTMGQTPPGVKTVVISPLPAVSPQESVISTDNWIGICRCLAEFNSAIQQIQNLRYNRVQPGKTEELRFQSAAPGR